MDANEAQGLGIELDAGTVLPVRRGAGWVACRSTGYQGRAGVFELLAVDGPMRTAVHHGAATDEVMRLARAAGMLTLREVAVGKLLAGETTLEEVLRVTAADH
jgi:type II secretory ATPase GspE/PulE/Tfp pilus assembly ATPase PilB-like protein